VTRRYAVRFLEVLTLAAGAIAALAFAGM